MDSRAKRWPHPNGLLWTTSYTGEIVLLFLLEMWIDLERISLWTVCPNSVQEEAAPTATRPSLQCIMYWADGCTVVLNAA